MTHDLKCWHEYFQAIWDGRKTFEIRSSDRGFKSGDLLVLSETDRDTGSYLDRKIKVEVTFTMESMGLSDGYVALGIKVLAKDWERLIG